MVSNSVSMTILQGTSIFFGFNLKGCTQGAGFLQPVRNNIDYYYGLFQVRSMWLDTATKSGNGEMA